ncbi:YeiH family putative sulfate export transporter [Pasteurella sp. PK-2025]|uniref:YeiH family putative sulfate export transporter n=1 Tax=Pasteurella sp. PK-2025 TaxID=3413133 RepID=UPI003C72E334
MKNYTLYFGLALVGLFTFIVHQLAHTEVMVNAKISALTMAILSGMLFGNTLYPKIAQQVEQGIIFAKGPLLRLGIILYGFRLTLQEISHVGFHAIATDVVMLVSTFFLTLWIGIRYLNMNKHLVYLTAGGCSICGAAAIMSMQPVIKAESHHISISVAVIVIFGTISMFLYPLMYPYLTDWLNEHQFGIYIGSSIHEVAQVYAAGGSIAPAVADTAVMSKMIRVMMLAPFLLLVPCIWRSPHHPPFKMKKITIPWFAFLFIFMVVINSFFVIPAHLVAWLIEMDELLLIAAMTALGFTTHISAVKQAGIKPLILGALVLCWLVIGGFFVNVGISQLW